MFRKDLYFSLNNNIEITDNAKKKRDIHYFCYFNIIFYMKMSIFCEVSEIMYLIVKMSTSLTPSLLYDICNFKNFIFIFKLFAVSFQCDFLTLAHNSQRIIFDEQFPSGFFFYLCWCRHAGCCYANK